jgi:hypothetical protein
MNKRQLEKEVERLRAEMDKRDENLNTIKKNYSLVFGYGYGCGFAVNSLRYGSLLAK